MKDTSHSAIAMVRQGSLYQIGIRRRLYKLASGNTCALLIALLVLPAGWAIGQDSGASQQIQAKAGLESNDDPQKQDPVQITGLAEPVVTHSSPIDLQIRADRWAEQSSTRLDVTYELIQASTGKQFDEKKFSLDVDSFGNTAPHSIQQSCPRQSGVYEVRIRFDKADDRLVRFRRPKPLLTINRVLVVVGDDVRPETEQDQKWSRVGQIQPGKKSDWDLDQWLPSSSRKLLRRIDLMPDIAHKRGQHGGEPIAIVSAGKAFTSSIPSHKSSQPHLVTLRFAAKHQHHLRIEVCDNEDFANSYRQHEVVGTKQALATDPWHTHTFVHYPRKSNEFLRITNTLDDSTVLLSSITVQAGPERLTTSGEDGNKQRLSVLHISRTDWVDILSSDIDVRHVGTMAARAHRFHSASSRLIDYAKAMGFNAVMISPGDSEELWYPTVEPQKSSESESFARYYLNSFLSLADKSNVQVLLAMEPGKRLSEREIEYMTASDDATLQRANSGQTLQANPHARLRGYVAQLQNQAKEHESFAGLVLMSRNERQAQTPIHDCDPILVRKFAARFGKDKLDPTKLRQWLAGDGKKAWPIWRERRLAKAYLKSVGSIPNVSIVCVADHNDETSSSSIEPIQPMLVEDYRQSVQQASFSGVDFATSIAKTQTQAVFVGQHRNSSNALNQLVSGSHSDRLLHSIAMLKPQRLFVQDETLSFSFNPQTRDALYAFLALPPQSAEVSAEGQTQELTKVWYADNDQGEVVLNLANLAPWPVTIQVECASVFEWESRSTADVASWQPTGRTVVSTLGGNSVLTLVAPSEGTTNAPAVVRWASQVSGGDVEIAKIKEKVTTIVKRIGVLSDPDPYGKLVNGGFERSSKVGIPGWMYTQHPPSAVRIDSGQSSNGEKSVLLTNDDAQSGRAWMVSETINPPSSGRLAVSMTCRAAQTDNGGIHQLRVAIEGVREGQSFRQSRILQVPKNGQWQPREIVLETLDLDQGKVESLRLTVDSLTTGKIWIDEIQLHDRFPAAAKRKALQADAFLAVTGIQRGNLTAAARLLNNYWANDLLNQQKTPELPAIQQATQANEQPPGVAERIKSWLPRSLRF